MQIRYKVKHWFLTPGFTCWAVGAISGMNSLTLHSLGDHSRSFDQECCQADIDWMGMSIMELLSGKTDTSTMYIT